MACPLTRCEVRPEQELCVVFDLDDTLFLERDYVRSGFQAVGEVVARTLGIVHFADRAWQLFESGCRGRIFDAVLAEHGWPLRADLIAALVAVYRTHEPEIGLLPDAHECLSSLHGIARLGLITDGPPIAQRKKVEALQVARFFDVMVFTDAWGEGYRKPHVRAFELVQSTLAGRDAHFVYVGDNPSKDFIAPVALGWGTVRLRRAGGLYAHVEAPTRGSPDTELPDLRTLRDLVEGRRAQGGPAAMRPEPVSRSTR